MKPKRWRNAICLSGVLMLLCTGVAWAEEVGAKTGVDEETLFSLLQKGGKIMIPLGIASILAMALAVERFISLRRERVLPKGFLDGLVKAWDNDPTGLQAEEFCEKSGGAAGHVFKAGIQWKDHGYEAVAKAIEDSGSREADKMKRSLRGLASIAAVSPLLGLLGTVYGMINAFQRTSASGGAAKTADLAQGIYEALVTTAVGLTIAIPVMLVFQFLSARVDGLIDYIDEVGTEFVVKHARVKLPAKADSSGSAGSTGSTDEPSGGSPGDLAKRVDEENTGFGPTPAVSGA